MISGRSELPKPQQMYRFVEIGETRVIAGSDGLERIGSVCNPSSIMRTHLREEAARVARLPVVSRFLSDDVLIEALVQRIRELEAS